MPMENHKVMAMDEEKRERVINAALTEFCKGYKHASTDTIVKEAGISKGLLYHYFGTKKELLFFLYEYVMEVMHRDFISQLDFKESDLLERLWKMVAVKMALSYKYPAIFDFIAVIFLGGEDELSEVSGKLRAAYETGWDYNNQIFGNIDYSYFKEGLDVQKAIEVIRWTLTGFSEKILKDFRTVKAYQAEYETIREQIKSYIDFFRTTFYK